MHRQLVRAARDPRHAYGETILTVWPPPMNVDGLNAVTRILRCDDDGDGRSDRVVTVPMPIFHVLGMLSDPGDRYWILPDRLAGGHVVSGFVSRDDRGVVRVLVYSHDSQDTQSRSGATFAVALDLAGLEASGGVSVREYRVDRDHNSPFQRAGQVLRKAPEPPAYPRAEVEEIRRLCECRPTGTAIRSREADGRVRLAVQMSGNGCTFLVVEPD